MGDSWAKIIGQCGWVSTEPMMAAHMLPWRYGTFQESLEAQYSNASWIILLTKS